MNGVVHGHVDEVADDKAGKKDKGIVRRSGKQFGKQENNGENNEGKNQAGYRRHKKSFLVTRVLVVCPVEDINDSLAEWTACFIVKQIAVRDVFKECPAKHSYQEQKGNEARRILQGRITVVQGV